MAAGPREGKSRATFPRSALVLVVAMLGIVAVACFGTESTKTTGLSPAVTRAPQFEAGSTMARIADDRVLRVGTRFDHPGLSARNLRGVQEGFEIDLVHYIAGRLGVSPNRIEWVEANSASREQLLQQNKVDVVVATMSMTDKRRKVISFGGPYLNVNNDLVTAKGNPKNITDPATPRGIKVCSTLGGAVTASLHRFFPDVNLVEFDVSSKCVDALKNGSVDALATQGPVGAGFVSKNLHDLELIDRPFTDERWGVGITKGDVAFCKFLNTVINDFYTDGSAQASWTMSLGRYTDQQLVLPAFDTCR